MLDAVSATTAANGMYEVFIQQYPYAVCTSSIPSVSQGCGIYTPLVAFGSNPSDSSRTGTCTVVRMIYPYF